MVYCWVYHITTEIKILGLGLRICPGMQVVNCDNCADGYLLVNGQCMRLVVLSPPDGVTQKYGSAFTTTSSGKRYLYTRHLAGGFKYLAHSS